MHAVNLRMGLIQTPAKRKMSVPILIKQTEKAVIRNQKQRLSCTVCKANLMYSVHTKIPLKLKLPPVSGGIVVGGL